MTQKDKELLLQDLCARLPYGVKCNAFLEQIDGSLKSIFGKFKGYNGWAYIGNNMVDIKTIKPYLRPMSSMTNEEEEELDKLFWNGFWNSKSNYQESTAISDFCYEHHLDNHDLIPKGLALEAPEGIYNIK